MREGTPIVKLDSKNNLPIMQAGECAVKPDTLAND